MPTFGPPCITRSFCTSNCTA